MIVSHLKVKNWRNFRNISVALRDRMFIIGPNASGKSNLLDVFRFLRDIAKPEGGGFQKAIRKRGGVSKVRCLAARKDPEIVIEIELCDTIDDPPSWRYSIGIKQETRGRRDILLSHEKVWRGEVLILNRPNESDQEDSARLTQTYLESINSNREFRDIANFLDSTTYLHLVPQLLRYAEALQSNVLEDDPFGQAFMFRIAKTSDKIVKSRLERIEKALAYAVPQLRKLQFQRDEFGRPHLEAIYDHWRAKGARQREDQFSDGTLRLIGLLWSLMEGDSLLLLEEPELSLNTAIIMQLPALIYRMQRARKRQVLISTHSSDMLNDNGIDGREVLLLKPSTEGTTVKVAADDLEIRSLLESGLSVADVVMPEIEPVDVRKLGTYQ